VNSVRDRDTDRNHPHGLWPHRPTSVTPFAHHSAAGPQAGRTSA